MIKGQFKRYTLLNAVANLDENKLYEVKIDEYSEHRSKTANAYYWVLVSELAGVLKIGKEELHKQLIKRYSNRDFVSVLSTVNISKYFPYYEEFGTYERKGKLFKSYIIFQRSSEMNKREFSNLLNGLIDECHQVGISTMTPEEIEKLKYLGEE